MERTRTDGQKLEQELEKVFKENRLAVPAYYIRLRTPQARYANVNNVADFILYGRISTILEVKETSSNSFSLNTFQQHDEVKKFKEFFDEAKVYYGWGNSYSYRIAILVHFIKHKTFTLYYLDNNPFTVLHPKDENTMEWGTLREALEYIITH